MRVKTVMHSELDVTDGGIVITDGGIHGVQGHTIDVAPDGVTARRQRRLDGMIPRGRAESGVFRRSPLT